MGRPAGWCRAAPPQAGERVTTSAVTSQWPRITPAMASARSASTVRSRPAGVAASICPASFRRARPEGRLAEGVSAAERRSSPPGWQGGGHRVTFAGSPGAM